MSYTPPLSEKVEAILKSENCTLEALINEEDTLSDLRSSCTELLD